MPNLNKYFDIKWLVLAFFSITIVILLTHIPQESMPPQIQQTGLDKILHALAYGTITFCIILSTKKQLSMYTALIVLCFLLSIGIADEITQPFVHRHASIKDLLFDAIGVITVLLLFLVAKQQFQKIKTTSVSQLLFLALVVFMAGIPVISTTILSLNKLNETNLLKQQKDVRKFFYNAMFKLLEGTYNPEEGVISQDALDTFKKYEHQLGGKCQLFISDDSYSRRLQLTGNFNCIAFFPSGNIFYVKIVQIEKNLFLKSLTSGSWETEWMEIMREIKQH